jgi:hypothetical protein
MWRGEVCHVSIESIPQPQLVVFDEWKHVFVSNRILVSNNQELLIVFDKLLNVLAEQREGWIRDNNIRHLQKLNALSTAKVTIPLQWSNSNLFWVWNVITILVTSVL